jgi:hypothetical protein
MKCYKRGYSYYFWYLSRGYNYHSQVVLIATTFDGELRMALLLAVIAITFTFASCGYSYYLLTGGYSYYF